VEIVVKMMGIPAFQRSSCWSSASVSSSSLLLLPPPLPTVQSSSSSPSSCSWWHKNRPPVNCCTVKLATKFLSSPVIDFQYYYKRKEASIAVVRAVASPSSPSSPMPAQQAVEEEEEKFASNEVTVVGAGPAGCLLAIYLLRRGLSVNLFEKREATKGQPVTPLLV
jgi:hypothetical protein